MKNAYGASELFGVAFITNDDLTTPLESVGISVPGVSFKIVQMDGEGDSDSCWFILPFSRIYLPFKLSL